MQSLYNSNYHGYLSKISYQTFLGLSFDVELYGVGMYICSTRKQNPCNVSSSKKDNSVSTLFSDELFWPLIAWLLPAGSGGAWEMECHVDLTLHCERGGANSPQHRVLSHPHPVVYATERSFAFFLCFPVQTNYSVCELPPALLWDILFFVFAHIENYLSLFLIYCLHPKFAHSFMPFLINSFYWGSP